MARSVAEKLGYRSGMTVLTVGRPDSLGDALNLPDNAREKDGADLLLVIVDKASAVAPAVKKILPHYRKGGRLWFAYPKKSGNIPTDISRDHGWGPLAENDLLPVTQIAIDGEWSALRFRFRDEIPKLTRKGEAGNAG